MNNVQQAIQDVKQGKFVVVIDDKSAEKSGYLLISAERATPDTLSFLLHHTMGVTSICLPKEVLDHLEIPEFGDGNIYGASVDYRHQRRTGSSPIERYRTIRALLTPGMPAADFKRPGHVYPTSYRKGGVITHARVGEAGVDLARLAGLMESAVFSQMVNESGAVATMEQALLLAKREQLTTITISDLVAYRWNCETLIKRIAQARLRTHYGDFTIVLYGSDIDDIEHIAMVKGEFAEGDEVLVRLHSECLTGEIFGSRSCDCGDQLHAALKTINEAGKGVVVYMRGHEGRGIGLAHKLRAYNLQEQGVDTEEANRILGFPADKRDYGMGAQILRDLGIKKVRLLTNNPKKCAALQAYRFDVLERVPLVCEINSDNERYLRAKKQKLGHLIDFIDR